MWSRCNSWRRFTILSWKKASALLSDCRTRLNASPISPQRRSRGWWQKSPLQQRRSPLKSLVLMSIHLSCKYAKRAVAGPEALGEALDATVLECLHASRPGLDIVCGDM